ncbi:MAG: PAS domain S-box protein [Nitrospirae bacterium]|nr:PAS domain S-box protein [Nitrospirota bacterium]
MKKKIIIGLSIFSLILLVAGVSIIASIESSTATLDNLITLHQVEILREHLLLQIKKVQSDINLKNTRYAKSMDDVITNVRNMEHMADTCFDCHHTPEVELKLKDLRSDVEGYKHDISRLFTLRSDARRLNEEEDKTYRKGEQLVGKVNDMIVMASSRLESKTQASLKEISRTKTTLYILVTVMPFWAGVAGFIFLRAFTRPVNALLKATRRLKAGDLGYKVEGLTDEFGEVASSFNEMSNSLKEYMLKIRETEKRYQTLFESAGDAIFIMEAEGENMGRIVSANHAAAEMHGYTSGELLKLSVVKDLDAHDAAKDAPERIRRLLNGEWVKAEIFHRKKDGTLFPVEISAGLFEYMGHKYIMAFDRDISARKETEDAIIRSHIMFTTVLDSIDAIIYVSDMKTYEILYMNNYARKIFGDVEGDICWQAFQRGQSAPCSFCTSDKLLTPEGYPAGVCHWEFQNTINGRWYDIRDNAIEWIDGRLVRMEIATDITERRKIDGALKKAEQMRLVGEWAAGLAHEIKNSLAGIKISVEVLMEELHASEEDRVTVLRAIDEIKRIDFLLKSLLGFAKPPRLRLQNMDVNELINKTIDFSLKQPVFSSNVTAIIDIVRDFGENIPHTMADPLQLQQAFMNILLNSGDALKGGGTITVKTSYDAGGDAVIIEMSDTGAGIDENILSKIFEPFFTTKSKGPGLGLTIARRIIEQHGGEISAGNTPAGGAAFRISLPVKKMEGERQHER